MNPRGTQHTRGCVERMSRLCSTVKSALWSHALQSPKTPTNSSSSSSMEGRGEILALEVLVQWW